MLICAASAQPNPASVKAQVDALFTAWDNKNSPGCALSVLQNGAVLYQRGYGMADLEHAVSITPNSVFQIASMSKQFTAMAILLLVQEGKLSLDDPVSRYIPELPDYGAPVTLGHMLHHTSGLRNLFPLFLLAGWRWGDLGTERNELDMVARQHALNFTPGEEYHYTNTGYFLLAEVVKRVAKQSFREFTTARIFEPLGMRHTVAFDDTGMILPNRAMAYNAAPGRGFLNNVTLDETVGASNIYTTVEDLVQWDANFYDAKVGGKTAIATMEQPGKLNNGQLLEYGAGLEISNHKGLRMIWHSGRTSYRGDYLRFPDHHFSVICLCNSGDINASDIARKVADIYLAEFEQQAPASTIPAGPDAVAGVEKAARAAAVTASPAELERLAGSYLLRDALVVRRALVDNGRLLLDRGRGVVSELVPVGPDRFVMLGVPERVEVVFAANRTGQTMAILPPGQRPIRADRVNPAITPDLHEYDGTFWSTDVGEPVTVAARESKLWLQTKRNVEFELRPLAADIFTNQWFGRLTFHRNATNDVLDLTMSNPEVRNFVMAKVTVRMDHLPYR